MAALQATASTTLGENEVIQFSVQVRHVAKPETAVFCSSVHDCVDPSNARARSEQSTTSGTIVEMSG